MLRPFDLIFAWSRFKFWSAGLRHQTFLHHDEKIHYWRGGTGSPVLLVHGLGGSTLQDFRHLAGHLAQRHHVICVDLPGYGLSHAVSFPQSVSSQAGFLRQFLDQLRVEQTHLLGNSMGGWIALKFAQQNPQRIRKMVLTASAGIRFEPPPLDVFTPNDEEGMVRLVQYLMHKPVKLPGWFVRDWLRISRQRRRAVRDMLDSMLTEKDLLDDHVSKIHVPTLILWGAHDRLIPPETGRRLASMMPHARLELIENCGPLLLHEARPAVTRHLDAWLDP